MKSVSLLHLASHITSSIANRFRSGLFFKPSENSDEIQNVTSLLSDSGIPFPHDPLVLILDYSSTGKQQCKSRIPQLYVSVYIFNSFSYL